uniref:DZF domain-containing protein n=1 Tax=Bursaphelenchus xylophilus TaxID=6326 RepID=A0A1I7SKP6_BURXY
MYYSHYCVTYTPDRNPLPLADAFKRFFQLLSAGFLLHCAVAVADPCDPSRRINYGFSPADADLICRTAQFICRLVIHEKFERLFGLKNAHKDVANENETDDSVNIAPLKEAYFDEFLVNKPDERKFGPRVTV